MTPLPKSIAQRLAGHPRLAQFIKFCLVGGSGVIVDMAVLHFLADPKWCGWNVTLGKLCSAETAMLNNFLWNELWTFRDLHAWRGHPARENSPSAAVRRLRKGVHVWRGHPCRGIAQRSRTARENSPAGVMRRLLKYHAICGLGFGLAVVLLNLFYHALGLNLYAANFLAILLATFWNFWMNALFNWRVCSGDTRSRS